MSEDIRSPSAHSSLWVAFGDKEYRHAFSEAHCADFLANQIFAMRVAREWNQSDLAKGAGVAQPQISTWESSCDGIRLDSLNKLANAFDVAVIVKFVPFSTLARETLHERSSKLVPSFDDDSPEAICRTVVSMTVPVTRPPVPRPHKGPDRDSYVKSYATASTSDWPISNTVFAQ